MFHHAEALFLAPVNHRAVAQVSEEDVARNPQLVAGHAQPDTKVEVFVAVHEAFVPWADSL